MKTINKLKYAHQVSMVPFQTRQIVVHFIFAQLVTNYHVQTVLCTTQQIDNVYQKTP